MVDLSKQLTDFINEQVEKDEFSGVVLITKNYKQIFDFKTGFANKEKNIPNKLDTIFNIGSMNKMFTAVVIAQLAEKRLLSFKDTVGKYLPDFPNEEVAKKITIHHLLTHTSGLGHYLANKPKYLANREKLHSIKDFISFFQDEPLGFEPGVKYEYSGNGYELLGAIIEAVSGQSYYDYIKEFILKVANMPNTDYFDLSTIKQNPDIAIGYTRRGDDGEPKTEGARRDNLFMALPKGGAGGGGYSTCKDLVNFSRALMENKLLKSEMTKLILTPKVEVGTKNGQTLYYGYGFQILDIGNGRQRIGHAGSFAGANTRLDIYPWLNYQVVVLSNYDEPVAFRVANKATELLI